MGGGLGLLKIDSSKENLLKQSNNNLKIATNFRNRSHNFKISFKSCTDKNNKQNGMTAGTLKPKKY